MKRKIVTAITGVFLTITTVLSLCLCLIDSPATAASSDLAGYFHINYDPAAFSKTEILGSEAFSATIHGNATCIKYSSYLELVKRGRVTGNVIAIHSVSGTRITLNSSYTITIDPFPSHLNDSVNMTVTASLQFPAHGEAGQYNIIAQAVKAEVWVWGGWQDVTDYVPASETLGTVNYTPAPVTPGTSSTPAPTPTPTPTPTLVLPASRLTISLWSANASSWRIDGSGFLLEEARVNSSNGSVGINIPANTRVLGANMEPIASIIIGPSNTALTPGKGYQVVAAYDCLPDGASFAPAIELTFAYNPDNLPAGADETNLKVAYFDKTHPNGELLTGDLAIDTDNHTVTFRTGHFSDFAVLASTGNETVSSTSSLPLIIAIGLIALGLILILIVVIRKRRLSR